ncbi:MAG TPA: PAS domain S-box protein [Blastocatellia bacterium]|nr:PAS domain S-box protein [Blastocatellia bacterium]
MTEAKLRLLLLDDDPDSRSAILRELRRAFPALTALEIAGAKEFEEAIRAGEFDLVIAEYSLSWSDGLEALRKVRARLPRTPVIMVTAVCDLEAAVEAMKLGLDDYIVKTDANLRRLPETVKRTLNELRLKAAAREISEEQSRLLAAIVESSDDAILSKSLDGIITSWNRAAELLFGYAAEEIIGQPVSLLVPPELADEFTEIMQRLKRGEHIDHYETVRMARDGRRIDVSLTISPIKNREGQLIGASTISRDIASRKRSEEALRESEERYRELFENANDMVYTLDLSGNLLSVNKAGERITGYDREELLNKPIGRIVKPRDRHVMVSMLERKLAGERLTTYELDVVSKSGRVLTLEVSSRLIYRNGVPVGIQGLARDITERKRAEAERQELLLREQAARKEAEQAQKLSKNMLVREEAARAQAEEALSLQRLIEERLMLLTEASSTLLSSLNLSAVLSGILDLAGHLTSSDAQAIWRYKRDPDRWEVVSVVGLSESYQKTIQVTGESRRLLDRPLIIENVEEEQVLAGRQDMLRSEGIRSMLVAPLRIHSEASGTITFYYRSPKRFTDAEIKVATALANLAASAITTAELYEQQSRLREEAQQAQAHSAFLSEASAILASSLDYETTLKNVASLAVPHFADWCVVDLVGADRNVNRLAVAHADPSHEWILRELQERFPFDPLAPAGVAAVLRTGVSELYPDITDELLEASARDPHQLSLLRQLNLKSAMCVPMLVRGRTLGAMTFVSSTADRRYDKSDLELAEELARRAALATDNALLYREAQQARVAAESASRVKDEFLANVSHELRTPLNAILGWAGVMSRSSLGEADLKHAVEIIERNAKSQSQLIEDLLDVSRIITGKLRLDVRPVELTPVVEAAVDVIRPSAEAKGVRLEVVLDPWPGPISGDPGRLQQVVWNLLSNAVKFTPKGGRVQVRIERTDSYAEITVSDTGQGISPHFLPFVFDRFRQADSSYNRRHSGLGLGLAIVRHLVELHGGNVEVHSPGEGLGATFKVRFPLMIAHGASRLQSQSAASDEASRRGESGIAPSPALCGLNVLVVEDDLDARELMKLLLEQSGANVRTATSATEAVETIQTWRPDVMVSDIEMPLEDGYILIRKVRMLAPDRGGLTPAVALTAHARSEDRLRALAAGFQAHVAKPVSVDELLLVIASVTGRVGREPVL